MTIKELMERSGISRANIRYYEEEGLLAPKRLPNGYRDYSEEDGRTLEKIKLLRQLHLDIDTIRLVQKGELTLEQALFRLLNKLEGDKAAINQAAEICRELCGSGVEYNALEPVQWLKQLAAPSRPGPPVLPEPSKPQPDGEPACRHPIMRLMARVLDTTLYRTAFYVVALGVFRAHWLLGLAPWLKWLESVAWLAVTLALEPLWLHFWGWTPGKWLFGLKLRDKNGEKLSLAQARERCRQVGWDGYRWHFPIWDLICMWRCFQEGQDGLNSDWDLSGGYRYAKVERFRGEFTGGVLWAAVYRGMLLMRRNRKIILSILAITLVLLIGIYLFYDNYRFGQELYTTACAMSFQSRTLANSIDYLEQEFEKTVNDPTYKVHTSTFDSAILDVHSHFGHDDLPLREDVRLEYIYRFEDLFFRSLSYERLKNLFTDHEEFNKITVLKNKLEILTDSLIDFEDRYNQMSDLERFFALWRNEQKALSDKVRISQ